MSKFHLCAASNLSLSQMDFTIINRGKWKFWLDSGFEHTTKINVYLTKIKIPHGNVTNGKAPNVKVLLVFLRELQWDLPQTWWNSPWTNMCYIILLFVTNWQLHMKRETNKLEFWQSVTPWCLPNLCHIVYRVP